MRYAKLALGSVIAVAAIAVPSAQAAPVWESCDETSMMPEFEDSLCSKTTGTKKWSWSAASPVSIIVTINSTAGMIRLKDPKGGVLGENLAVECESSGKGKVGGTSAKKGVIEEIRWVKCKTISVGNCETPTATSANTPWETELTEPMAGVIRDKVKNGGSGAPGFKIACKGVIEDTCTGETSAKAFNENTSGFVEEEFEAKSEKLSCTRSGANMGEISGTDKTLRTINAGLRVH